MPRIHNGKLLADDATFPANPWRAFRYGDGIFETMRMVGGKVLFADDHAQRLQSGCEVLKLQLHVTNFPEFLEEQAERWIASGGTPNARLRISVYRNDGGYYFPESNEASWLLEGSPMSADPYEIKEFKYEVDVLHGQFKATGILSNLKSLNGLLYIYAAMEAERNGLNDLIIQNHQKELLESISSSLLIYSGNNIITSPLSSGAIDSIMRRNVMRLAIQSGITVEETPLFVNDLLNAKEIWLCNTIRGIQPVTRFRNKSYSNELATKMIALLNQQNF